MENIAFVVTTQRMEMLDVVREHYRLIWAVESPVTLIILDGMPNIINHIIELRLVWDFSFNVETNLGISIFFVGFSKILYFFGMAGFRPNPEIIEKSLKSLKKVWNQSFLKQKRLNQNGMFCSILKIMVILCFATR